MILSDLLDVDLLFAHVRDGYVTGRSHPDTLLGLTVWNYTPKCQFERAWDDVTTKCRGLITRSDQEVVARPWPKFWNYGEVEGGLGVQPDGPSLDLDAPAEVFDKLDGSLGILYPARDFLWPWAIATRGSFESEQARHGTYVLRERYSGFEPLPGWTYLFEIVYPANRIVVDYGPTDDLVFLGAVSVETGRTKGADREFGWPGPRAEPAPANSLREALALEPRRNAEGLVVLYDEGVMLKIKQEAYVALHRIVTGLNERVVWERLGAGELLEDIQRGLPEEFAEWVADVYVRLTFRADSIYYDVRETFRGIVEELERPPGMDARLAPLEWTRKDFAERALRHPDVSAMLFMMLDEKPVKDAIWRLVKPAPSAPRDFEDAE